MTDEERIKEAIKGINESMIMFVSGIQLMSGACKAAQADLENLKNALARSGLSSSPDKVIIKGSSYEAPNPQGLLGAEVRLNQGETIICGPINIPENNS